MLIRGERGSSPYTLGNDIYECNPRCKPRVGPALPKYPSYRWGQSISVHSQPALGPKWWEEKVSIYQTKLRGCPRSHKPYCSNSDLPKTLWWMTEEREWRMERSGANLITYHLKQWGRHHLGGYSTRGHIWEWWKSRVIGVPCNLCGE
jgi:hypothetical protein